MKTEAKVTTNKDININIHHLTRVEGHGNIVVNVREGKIEKCEWQIPEAPRFFEAMIRGRHYSEVARITSRICGICSIGHTLASVKTTEDALGIIPTEQTQKLRKIAKHAENFDSHILHIYFLAAPDLLGAPSVFPLLTTHGEIVKRALRLKRLAHEWGSLIAGRTTHPTTILAGGFAEYPKESEMRVLKNKLESAMDDLEKTANTLVELLPAIPKFERLTEYVSLSSDKEYEIYDGNIKTTLPSGKIEHHEVNNYLQVANEYVVPISTAKH
ncbi:MAG: nickel-dependent hydrogenase large subunit, partial [Oligoflexia bacterium]|nr:nickel-dependent hydrogenase large subunit [Oligoflexia bacterium]